MKTGVGDHEGAMYNECDPEGAFKMAHIIIIIIIVVAVVIVIVIITNLLFK